MTHHTDHTEDEEREQLPSEENPHEPENANVPPEDVEHDETSPSPPPGRSLGGGVGRGSSAGGGSAAT